MDRLDDAGVSDVGAKLSHDPGLLVIIPEDSTRWSDRGLCPWLDIPMRTRGAVPAGRLVVAPVSVEKGVFNVFTIPEQPAIIISNDGATLRSSAIDRRL